MAKLTLSKKDYALVKAATAGTDAQVDAAAAIQDWSRDRPDPISGLINAASSAAAVLEIAFLNIPGAGNVAGAYADIASLVNNVSRLRDSTGQLNPDAVAGALSDVASLAGNLASVTPAGRAASAALAVAGTMLNVLALATDTPQPENFMDRMRTLGESFRNLFTEELGCEPWGGDIFVCQDDFKPDPLDIDPTTNNQLSNAQHWVPPARRDPLTFDLDGDGLETVGIDPNNPILFDHDADGIRTASGWVSADDAFLVLDRDGNGTIDDGTELFGNSTPLDAGGTAVDGFDALARRDRRLLLPAGGEVHVFRRRPRNDHGRCAARHALAPEPQCTFVAGDPPLDRLAYRPL